jgi:hypothetical protein
MNEPAKMSKCRRAPYGWHQHGQPRKTCHHGTDHLPTTHAHGPEGISKHTSGPCTVDVGLGDKRALHRPSSTLRSRIGKRMIEAESGTMDSADWAQEVGEAIAARPARQCNVPSLTRHDVISPEMAAAGSSGKFASAKERVAKVSVERTVCTCSSSPMWQPDANRVHIKITRYTKNPLHETAHHDCEQRNKK